MNRLSIWWSGLAPREQQVLSIGGVVAALILLLGGYLSLHSSIKQLRNRVAQKQSDLTFFRSVAGELSAAGPLTRMPATRESLLVTVDSTTREAGLAAALAGTESTPDGALRMRLTGASFDAVVAALARLAQQHGVQVANGNVDAASGAGLVNAQFTLKAPGGG